MTVAVSDKGSNVNDNLDNAARAIGRSTVRRAIFDVVYTGKKRVKAVSELSRLIGENEKRVLTEGKKLADSGLFKQIKHEGRIAYEKDDWYHAHKRRILQLVDQPAKLIALPTKTRPASRVTGQTTIHLPVPSRLVKAHRIGVDDISEWKKCRQQKRGLPFVKIPESRFKAGVQKLLGERGRFKDWGGESNDLSTRLTVAGRRRAAVFAFKGPGKTGILTPAKLGKNGDQIQRLFKASADVYFVQYWRQIADSVVEQMHAFAMAKSVIENRPVWFGVIDGADSARLIAAYSNVFTSPQRKRKRKK